MPYLYIYEIVNTANGHTYVGQRPSTCLPAVDVYWGSGFIHVTLLFAFLDCLITHPWHLRQIGKSV